MAEWLNTTFAGLDGAMFTAVNSIKCGFLTWVSELFAFLGDGGMAFIIASVILIAFSKTRKIGVCMLLAIAVGALFTNITLKPLVARPRPYTDLEYVDFWKQVGAHMESERSFPSGHTTSATAFFVALFIACDKKWSWAALPFALVMAFTRVYLIVHYTTDVIAGLIVGSVAAVISFYLTKLIFKVLNKYSDVGFCRFCLSFGVESICRSIYSGVRVKEQTPEKVEEAKAKETENK